LQFWLQFDPEILAGFPVRFTSIEAAREHCQRFFRWYNHEHATAAQAFTHLPMSATATPEPSGPSRPTS
jgi:hypothetical protein